MSELFDTAALYLLGQLSPEETAAFDARLAQCDAPHKQALAEATELVAGLAFSAPAASPPPGLKARLLERIQPDPYAGFGSLRVHEQGEWKPTQTPGVFHKRLYRDKESGLVTRLVKMEPGARLGAHAHQRTEQCLILQGDLRYNEEKIYRAGDFTWAQAGTLDPALYTVEGNVLLIIGD